MLEDQNAGARRKIAIVVLIKHTGFEPVADIEGNGVRARQENLAVAHEFELPIDLDPKVISPASLKHSSSPVFSARLANHIANKRPYGTIGHVGLIGLE